MQCDRCGTELTFIACFPFPVCAACGEASLSPESITAIRRVFQAYQRMQDEEIGERKVGAVSETKFTKGRWESCHDADGDYTIFCGTKIIAITDRDHDEDKANAELMKAAPMLYEALEAMLLLASIEGIPAKITQERYAGILSAARGEK